MYSTTTCASPAPSLRPCLSAHRLPAPPLPHCPSCRSSLAAASPLPPCVSAQAVPGWPLSRPPHHAPSQSSAGSPLGPAHHVGAPTPRAAPPSTVQASWARCSWLGGVSGKRTTLCPRAAAPGLWLHCPGGPAPQCLRHPVSCSLFWVAPPPQSSPPAVLILLPLPPGNSCTATWPENGGPPQVPAALLHLGV